MAYEALAEPARWTFIAYDDRFADMPQQRWLLGNAGERPVSCELGDISSQLVAARAGAGRVSARAAPVGSASAAAQEGRERPLQGGRLLLAHALLRPGAVRLHE